MEERFTKLNDFYRPAVETALRPFTAAPAAAGERRLHTDWIQVARVLVVVRLRQNLRLRRGDFDGRRTQ